MSRLIDADVLEKRLRDAIDFGRIRDLDGTHELQAVLSDVEKMPTIEPEPKWIPCSERLPETYGNYITTMNYGDVQECTYSPEKNTRFMRGGWSTCESDGTLFLNAHEVIAWMPLPEPYREEGEE